MDEDEEVRGTMEHGVFHRCMQTENVEGLKITVGALERSLYDMEKNTEETLARLEKKLEALTKTIEDNNLMVRVNKDGIAANVKLNDVIQFFMDRPSIQIKKVETTISRLVDSAKDIVWIFGAICMIIYAINAVLKFARP